MVAAGGDGHKPGVVCRRGRLCESVIAPAHDAPIALQPQRATLAGGDGHKVRVGRRHIRLPVIVIAPGHDAAIAPQPHRVIPSAGHGNKICVGRGSIRLAVIIIAPPHDAAAELQRQRESSAGCKARSRHQGALDRMPRSRHVGERIGAHRLAERGGKHAHRARAGRPHRGGHHDLRGGCRVNRGRRHAAQRHVCHIARRAGAQVDARDGDGIAAELVARRGEHPHRVLRNKPVDVGLRNPTVVVAGQGMHGAIQRGAAEITHRLGQARNFRPVCAIKAEDVGVRESGITIETAAHDVQIPVGHGAGGIIASGRQPRGFGPVRAIKPVNIRETV